MATTVLSSTQAWNYTPSTGAVAPGFGLIATIGGEVEYWLQPNASSLAGQLGSFISSAFSITFGPSWAESGTMTIYTLRHLVSGGFTNAYVPRPAVVVGTVDITFTGVPPNPTVSLPLRDATTGVATALLMQLGRSSTRLPLGFSWNGVGGTFAAVTPTVTHQQGFTGLAGQWQARGRADECPKCGHKSTRDTWVRDGYTKMMVCGECFDEEDRVGRHYVGLGSERPGSGEG